MPPFPNAGTRSDEDKTWISIAFGALCTILVLWANRGAWHGYFQGDDLDTLGWTRYISFSEYLKGLLSPLYMPNHFRPAGHLIYYLLLNAVGLNFGWYLACLQMLHLLNLFLLWKLIRTIGGNQIVAGLGILFFAFHMAVIDAYWKPQFVFDVLCATFSLSCINLFVRRKYIWSFLCFWLAYKSKELGVMLPFVLAAYEIWLGERRWKPLLPFLIAGLSFGLQGAIVGLKTHTGTPYALHFTRQALVHTSSFYFSKIFLGRGLGFLLLLAPVFFRDRRLFFAIAAFCLFLVPLLPMSDRTIDVFLYVPLTALAIVVSVLAESLPNGQRIIAGMLLLWLPWNYLHSRSGRRYELAAAAENRAYVDQARRFVAIHPSLDNLGLSGWPRALGFGGARGTFLLLCSKPVNLYDAGETGPWGAMRPGPIVAAWSPRTHSIELGLNSKNPGAK